MGGALFSSYCRRADGRGSVWIGTFSDRCAALSVARQKFAADHSVTMAWVIGPCGHTEGDVLARDPPGASQ